MSQANSREIYSNEICYVIVEIRPDDTKYCYGPDEEYEPHRIFASVKVFALDREHQIYDKQIMPWGEFKWEGKRFPWQKKKAKIVCTASDKLEQYIVEAIKTADKYLLDYNLEMQNASEVLEVINHVVTARAEVQKLVHGMDDNNLLVEAV